jgi:16S rRNA (guanine966-N2)-methyltransferase
VREALFSRLDHQGAVAGRAVLDLYAGSGALGLEAASRGARQVVLVEAAREAASTCRENAKALGLAGVVRVEAIRVETYLRTAPAERFDLVLLDPPYELGDDVLAADLRALADRWLGPGTVVVVERGRRAAAPRWPEGMEGEPPRAYGDTLLWFATVKE